VNDGLIDAFRHNAWATGQVLDACRGLSDEQLNATVAGTYGSIIDTLRHTVGAEGNYLARLSTGEPGERDESISIASVADLTQRAANLAGRWEQFLAEPFDAERAFVYDWYPAGTRDVPAGVVLTQALHHANEHRTQICTTLTSIGVEAPALGVWEFAEATNRALERQA